MDPEQLISFAESVCGNQLWEEIIPFLKSERKNNYLADIKVFDIAIDIANIRLAIYEQQVNS